MTDRLAEEERQLQEAIALSMQEAPTQPTHDDDDEEMRQALALSMQQPESSGAPRNASSPPAMPPAMDFTDADSGGPSLAVLVFGDRPSGEVIRQWKNQGISFADVDLSASPGITPFSAGLAQEYGGPCAILAAAQAFMMRRLLFDPTPEAPQATPQWLEGAAGGGEDTAVLLPSELQASQALYCGLADILCACACTPSVSSDAPVASGLSAATTSCAVLAVPSSQQLSDGSLLALPLQDLLATLVNGALRPVGWAATLDALRSRAEGLASPLGALSLLLSALLTRTATRFSSERDDPSQPLLDAQFGHCSQEMLNLLLLGVGVSNIFDGSKDLGGGFVLRGVPSRPPIGLLSQLEALRYLQVGSFFKAPSHPIWVVASESHYSLLFALTNDVQQTDAAAQLEERLQQAFSEFDSEGNGFISGEHLQTLVSSLPEWQCPSVEELRGQLDPDRCSLIVWDTFQRVMMPLHPRVAEHIELQRRQEQEQQQSHGFSAKASSQPGVNKPMVLYHYNGLGAKGHENKRALRKIDVLAGGAAGQPSQSDGLASCICTRWKDALVTYEGPPPSIN
jgi:hypothetical protein